MNNKLSPSEYADVIEAWRETWQCLSPKEKSQLITKMGDGWEKGEVDVNVYEELCDWYEAEVCAEEEEEDDIITIHPADYDEYHEDEEEEHRLSFDEDDQYYEERLDFHLTAYFNNR